MIILIDTIKMLPKREQFFFYRMQNTIVTLKNLEISCCINGIPGRRTKQSYSFGNTLWAIIDRSSWLSIISTVIRHLLPTLFIVHVIMCCLLYLSCVNVSIVRAQWINRFSINPDNISLGILREAKFPPFEWERRNAWNFYDILIIPLISW